MRVGRAVLLCLAAVVAALALAPGAVVGEGLQISPPPGWRNPAEQGMLLGRYLRLDNWDSVHFVDIALHGYQVPEPPVTREDVHAYRANVTFLPAYPLVVGMVARVTGLSGQVSALVTAELLCVLFWALLFLWFERAGVSQERARGATWLLFLFPSSFYLVAGYTESLYLSALVGYVLFTDQVAEGGGGMLAASALGMVLTGTRLVGLPAVGYPALRALLGGKQKSRLWLVSALSTLGALGFFAYCQLRFGHWDLYFRLLEIGWGQTNSPVAFLFNPRSYYPAFFFEDTHVSLNRAAVPLCLLLLFWGARQDWRLGRSRPLALRLTGLALLYLAMAGKAASGMDGMIRYALPVVCLAGMARAPHFEGGHRKTLVFLGAVFGLAQLYLLRRYLLGHWVS